MFLLFNEGQKLVLQVRPSTVVNDSIDITAVNDNDGKWINKSSSIDHIFLVNILEVGN